MLIYRGIVLVWYNAVIICKEDFPLDENKDKTLSGGNDESYGSTFDRNTEDVKKEMEELAATFQRELDKTKAEAEEKGELIQELEDIPEASTRNDDEEPSEAELCECCGEKRRGTKADPDSPYCEECDLGLRHYPFSFLNIFFVVVVIALVFYSGYVFAGRMGVLNDVYKADKYVSQKKMDSAVTAYEDAVSAMEKAGIKGELVYKRQIMANYRIGYLQDIDSRSDHINSWELSLPHFRSVKKAMGESADFIATVRKAYTILTKYDVNDPSDFPYDDAMAALVSLESEPYTEDTTANTSSATTSSVKATQYNKAMVYYYEYYVSVICNKDNDEQLKYLEKIKEEYPQYIWLYGSALGDLYAKTGKDVTEICDKIRSNNSEDPSPDLIEIESLRIKGDYDAAIAKCEEYASPDDCTVKYEIYRQEALCYILKDDYDTALETAKKAYDDNGNSLEVIDTLALCAVLKNDDATYSSMESLLDGSGYSLSDKVTGFKAGTVTLDDILLKGAYDVE